MSAPASSHGGNLLANAVRRVYAQGQIDYSIEPLVRVDETGEPVGLIRNGDAVIFCCRRGEREIELTEAFTEPDFPHFDRQRLDINFVILTLYHEKFKDLQVAFLPTKIKDTLGEVISRAGLRQLRCSESEKFAHVTFFFNGGNSQPFPGETDVRVPSLKGIPFEQVPELSLPQVADEVIRGIQAGHDLIVTNFANGDVIGHTANTAAKIKCAEYVDFHLGRVIQEAKAADYILVVTADHGNLEELLTEEGKPHVAHTSNPVPLIIFDPRVDGAQCLSEGSLQDLAPTILQMMGLPQPEAMSGNPLVKGHRWNTGRRVLLIILDGWGIGKQDNSNPIYLASTPVWDELVRRYPPSHLKAYGEAVGLREGKPGNSEAGHMNIGAGRIVPQDDVRLDQAMNDGSFEANEVFQRAVDGVLERGTSLHLIGLLTEKSSHGSIDYPLALLRLAKKKGVKQVFLHMIFDGRSTEPGSAPALLEKLEKMIVEIGVGQIVSGIGRGIALDRDGNYAKIKRAYDAFVSGVGQPYPEK